MSILKSYNDRIVNVERGIESLYEKQKHGFDVMMDIIAAKAKLKMLRRNRDRHLYQAYSDRLTDEALNLARRGEL